ncbi:hypothetical protein [Phaeospirillum tilakii]|jgi:hypothetical protein|uniref:Uncharacterized protein n=1 Tax=Phaeospirillum tilakii TaxID=741673 RepID=A0ABW5C7U4_9PROT
MIRLVAFVILVLAVLITTAVVMVSAWDPTPPTVRIERMIPDDHFPR